MKIKAFRHRKSEDSIPVSLYISNRLNGRSLYSGDSNLDRDAFGRLVEILVDKNILTVEQVLSLTQDTLVEPEFEF